MLRCVLLYPPTHTPTWAFELPIAPWRDPAASRPLRALLCVDGALARRESSLLILACPSSPAQAFELPTALSGSRAPSPTVDCPLFQVFELPAAPWRDAAVSAALDALLDAWTTERRPDYNANSTAGGSTTGGSTAVGTTAVGSAVGTAPAGTAAVGSTETRSTKVTTADALLGSEHGTDVASLVKRVLDHYLAGALERGQPRVVPTPLSNVDSSHY